ncbi:hypothetical protein OSB04_005718 [Centaurea solstitialis]|uniref:Reverse transcriptase zinc-binding domain-containing protein n=1 Tax=Centaurea solstitialis TaxID=347529 RepID=A0AA38U184_9ASTR|nr:hypothetical protein OSB04_005718 [Centaurea solstitialis]
MGVSVPKEEVQRVARWLKCKEGSLPFTYLGLPVGDNMSKASAWQPIIEKFKSRLSLWKAKNVSAGGRLCLIKSVLGGLGNYFFSLYKAPNKVLNSLESIRRKFFWGEVNHSRKINWVAWEKVLRDKKSGGLGIGSLKALNMAMLAKWWWREKVEPNAKWKLVISAISETYNGSSSGVWKSIRSIDRELGDWGINLQNLMVPNGDNRGWCWQLDDNGEFSVRSLRKFIDCLILPTADAGTTWVSWATSKANIHLWRVMNNRLATMDNLIKRGVSVPSDGCKFCNSYQESADHVFAVCSTTKIVSAYLSNWINRWPTNACSVSDLWARIDSISKSGVERNIRRTIGAAFLYVIWNQRNMKTFSGAVKKETKIAEDIKFLAFDWIRCRVKSRNCVNWESWCVYAIGKGKPTSSKPVAPRRCYRWSRSPNCLADLIGFACHLGWGRYGSEKRGRLGPRFIGPFKVIACVGKVAYRLELPLELSQIHNTFHVSQLRKCLADETAHVAIDDIQVDEKLNYIERPIAILERKTKSLRNKKIGLVKVQWEHSKGSEWTWEPETEIRSNYPELFHD